MGTKGSSLGQVVQGPGGFVKTLPRVIWSFWDGPVPPAVKACSHSWRQHAPNWTIRLLDRTTAKTAIGTDVFDMRMTDGPTRAADLIRLHLIHKHGGLWLDASVLLTAPLESWVHPSDFTGFSITLGGCSQRVHENWAFAACPGDPFVTAWLEAFVGINRYRNVEHWLGVAKSRHDLSQIPGNLQNYLAMHCCAEIVKQTRGKQLPRQRMYRAEDTALAWIADKDWNPKRGAAALEDGTARPSFIHKFRGCDRPSVEQWLLSITPPEILQ